MTNKEILQIALQQSAYDVGCEIEDFNKDSNIIVDWISNSKARKYLEFPIACSLVSYGSNIVASTYPEYRSIVKEYISKYDLEHCFETPNLHVLNDAFEKYDQRVCFMAEYFLPDLDILQDQECQFETRILTQEDFKDLYISEWSNALCQERKELDMIGIGAYDDRKLIGLAGASADCETMWQIGVDVLPDYRRKKIAAALTSKLALEILKKDIVPFYCCAWSNIKSARNAIKAGFKPAWVELSVKSREFVEKLNMGGINLL